MKLILDISQDQLDIIRTLIDEELDKCQKREVNRDHMTNTFGVYQANLEELIKQLC